MGSESASTSGSGKASASGHREESSEDLAGHSEGWLRAVSTNRRHLGIAVAAVVGVAAVVWVWIAVVSPVARDAACDEVHLRAGPEGDVSGRIERPPIGGGTGLGSSIREALRGDVAVAYCNDFADPSVLRVGETYYAYSTNTDEYHVPVLVSGGLFDTGQYHEALPELPAWTEPGFVWAPTVLATRDGYVMYYSTRAGDTECLSTAYASDPAGPFVDDSDAPLVCPPEGGAIDPDPLETSDGRAFLYWKEWGPERDGIVVAELSEDRTTIVGETYLLVEATEPWEDGLVEAPAMWEHDGGYTLFYSANEWQSTAYGVGYAQCDSPLGPCLKVTSDPWLSSTDEAMGPGGQAIFDDVDGATWMVVHAWVGDDVGYPDGARNLFVLRLDVVDGQPSVR